MNVKTINKERIEYYISYFEKWKNIPKIDINKAKQQDLQKIPYIGPVIATKILCNRPYDTSSNFILELQKIGIMNSYTIIMLNYTFTINNFDLLPNINYITKQDLQEIDGIGKITADYIINNRPYLTYQDLFKINISNNHKLELLSKFTIITLNKQESVPKLNELNKEEIVLLSNKEEIVLLSNKEVGYCIKCKRKQEILNPREKRSANDLLMMQGECSICSTKITKIIKKNTETNKQQIIPKLIETNKQIIRIDTVSEEIIQHRRPTNKQIIRIDTVSEEIIPKLIETNKQQIIPKLDKIPYTLRMLVWKTYASNVFIEAECYCCRKNKISIDNFTCGHIKSKKNGGIVNLTNLRPICVSCNSSMNSCDMNEFIEKYKLWSTYNIKDQLVKKLSNITKQESNNIRYKLTEIFKIKNIGLKKFIENIINNFKKLYYDSKAFSLLDTNIFYIGNIKNTNYIHVFLNKHDIFEYTCKNKNNYIYFISIIDSYYCNIKIDKTNESNCNNSIKYYNEELDCETIL
jgi:5-methylcytosine-specific restriction endonuclease McrA